MAREAKAEFLGHQIAVRVDAWSEGAKLYIDGVAVDSSKSGMGKGFLVRGAITEAGKVHIVEVTRRFAFTQPTIFVDGKEIK